MPFILFNGWHVLARQVRFLVITINVTIEVPDEDSIVLAHTNNLAVVFRVEEYFINRICVSNEALEIVWCGVLSLVVPDFDHVVFAAGEEVT